MQPSVTPSVTPSMVPSSSTPSAVPSTRQPSVTPSMIPSSSTPSAVPSTMQPSVTPTSTPTYSPSTLSLSPSSYPTYTLSVTVHFTVTHVLSGISTATYSSNKAFNDAMFRQVVVSMMGFNSVVDAVSIQLVTDVAASRYLVATTAAETELVYSISTPTRIFDNNNHATARFIQALNESIVTSAFDTLLRAAGNDWQTVTTEYVIFSTASPTSSPTSLPTSSPTIIDVIAASILAIPLDGAVAKAKVKYYLGAFAGYFLAIYICLYLYSFLRYGKGTVTKLYDTSYNSEINVRNCTILTSNKTSNSNLSILSDLYTKNKLIQKTRKLEEELNSVVITDTWRLNHESTNASSTTKSSAYSVSVSKKLDSIFTLDEKDKYSKGYREYVQQRRTLLGCSPFLYPEGCVVKIPCASKEIKFPPGRVEDILLFLCHNHPLFSCFYFMDGSKLGAHGTRILYIGKEVSMFVLYQFSNMLLQYLMLDGQGLGTFINLFIITPSAVSVGLLLKYLYTCPFTETIEFQRKYAKYQSTVLFFGRLAIVPVMFVMCGSLIIACLFSSGHRIPIILVNYFLYVQFYGVLLEIAKVFLLFIDNYYFRLSFFGVLDLLYVGQLYKERIVVEQLVVDVDYACRINNYLFGLIKVQKILNRDDAIKAKWITEGGGEEEKGYDIVMKVAAGREEDAFAVQINPLQKELSIRDSAVFSMDDTFGAENNDEEVGDEYDVYSNTNNTHDTLTPTENPIHSLVSVVTIDKQRARMNSKPNKVVEDHSVIAEDDAALYLEYQIQQNTHDDAVYDIGADDSVVVMSFEEWKTRRKQFKQGTDSSLT